MIIKSNFKDYYDYVPHLYGGGDPKIVYPRTRIKELDNEKMDNTFQVIADDISRLPYRSEDSKFDYAWLIFCGKYIPMIRKKKFPSHLGHIIDPWKDEIDGFHVISESHQEFSKMMHRKKKYSWLSNPTIDTNKVYDSLLSLSRDIGHPVFVIVSTGNSYSYNSIRISRKCPNLGSLGLPSLYSAEQAYQELSYFIGNIMNDSPDLMPEPKPPMTNTEKIVSHGFDLKQSFRGKQK